MQGSNISAEGTALPPRPLLLPGHGSAPASLMCACTVSLRAQQVKYPSLLFRNGSGPCFVGMNTTWLVHSLSLPTAPYLCYQPEQGCGAHVTAD